MIDWVSVTEVNVIMYLYYTEFVIKIVKIIHWQLFLISVLTVSKN